MQWLFLIDISWPLMLRHTILLSNCVESCECGKWRSKTLKLWILWWLVYQAEINDTPTFRPAWEKMSRSQNLACMPILRYESHSLRLGSLFLYTYKVEIVRDKKPCPSSKSHDFLEGFLHSPIPIRLLN